eukprot:4231364-Amphidinium_carterae.1
MQPVPDTPFQTDAGNKRPPIFKLLCATICQCEKAYCISSHLGEHLQTNPQQAPRSTFTRHPGHSAPATSFHWCARATASHLTAGSS